MSRAPAKHEVPPPSKASASIDVLERLLDKIQRKAEEADRKAAEACKKSKYSIQDYWMCMEFWTQRLHDELAKEVGLPRRCPIFPFRAKLLQFKRDVSSNAKLNGGPETEGEEV